MADFDAIGTALAARYLAAQVTPPTGYRNIRVATTALPNQISMLPAVLVFPEGGDFHTGNGTRVGQSKWTLRFYYDESGDLSRAQAALLAWATVLVSQLLGAVQLGGTAGVTRAVVDSWKPGTMTYAEKEFVGIELGVTVDTSEAWTAAA